MKGRNQFLVGMRGSVENMTVTTAQDGDKIVRGKITQTTNPNTAEQQSVRSRFRRVLDKGKVLLAFLNLYFFPQKKLHSPINAFLHYNLRENPKITSGQPETEFDDADYYTYGRLYDPVFMFNAGSSLDNGNGTHDVVIDWNYDATSEIQEATDAARVLVLNTETLDYQVLNPAATRDAGTATVTVAEPSSSTALIVPFLVNAAGTDATRSKPIATLSSAGVLAAV